MNRKIKLLYNYTQGVLGLSSNDIIFTSFPKSGNTWVRFFFCNLISLNEWNGQIVDYTLLDKTMPELGVSNLMKKWKHPTIPRIVKTHKPFWSIFKWKKAILLVRDPKDVMISFYKYEMGKKEQRFNGTFSEFIRHQKFGLEAWGQHYLSWRDKAGLVLFYEDLKQNNQKEFQKIIDYLGVQVEEKLFLKAIESSDVKKVKKVEAKFGLSKKDEFKKDYSFANKGGRGNWKDAFSNDDINYYKEVMKNNNINIYSI